MGAITVSSSANTEFAGTRRVYCAKVSPATNADTLDLSGQFDSIDSAVATFAESPDANCALIYITESSCTLTFNLLKVDGSTGASTYKDMYVVVVGCLDS